MLLTCAGKSAGSGRASGLAVTVATGSDSVFSLFKVRRRLAAIAVSASALVKSSEAS